MAVGRRRRATRWWYELSSVAGLAWLGIACGPSSEASEQQSTTGGNVSGNVSTTGGTADCTPVLTMCEALAERTLRCEDPPPDRDAAIAECVADFGPAEDRLNPCFVEAYTECLPDSPCNNDDACFTAALRATDPGSFDAAAADRCEASGESCDVVAMGMLRECLDRFAQCPSDLVFEDLCVNLVILLEPYKSEAHACLERECSELDACLGTASGTTAD